jgi:hypothetical protein
MAGVVAERGHAQRAAPVLEVERVRRDDVADVVCQVLGVRDHVEDARGELHHAERMLEPLVGGARVDQIGHRQLVDMPQSLEGGAVEHWQFRGPQLYEHVQRVADLDGLLRRHRGRHARAAATSLPRSGAPGRCSGCRMHGLVTLS